MGAIKLHTSTWNYPFKKVLKGGALINKKPVQEVTHQVCVPTGGNYMFGFNGKEKTNEVYGEGNAYDFGARMYDSRIGRWQAVDIIKQPSLSPYNAFANCPILYLDPDGRTQVIGTDGSILYDDKKNDGNLYRYSGDPLNYTHFSVQDIKNNKGDFTQLTRGRFKNGTLQVKWVSGKDDVLWLVGTVRDRTCASDEFKNIDILLESHTKADDDGGMSIRGIRRPGTSGVRVKDPTEGELVVKVTKGYSKNNYFLGNVYDLQNVVEHEKAHFNLYSWMYNELGADKPKDQLGYKTISNEELGGLENFSDFKNQAEIGAYSSMMQQQSWVNTSPTHKKTATDALQTKIKKNSLNESNRQARH